jgi:hypothetical protein
MGYPVSTMIGIRTGGVFSGATDEVKFKKQITDIIQEWGRDVYGQRGAVEADDLDWCMSQELTAAKGTYVVIAGVFNYWSYEGTGGTAELGKLLSKKLGVEIMVMTWDEETNRIDANVFLGGHQLHDVNENSVSRIMRRIG